MKVVKFGGDIPSIPIDNFKDHCMLIFDITSMQDSTEHWHYPELVGEPLRHELNFIFALDYATEVFILVERMSSVAIDKFGVVGKQIQYG